MDADRLTTIELFAGIGGFCSPHTRALAFVEKDADCRAVLRRHYPGALIRDNVRAVGAENLPWAHVVKFGFPCQDLSVAGARAGLTGARSGLFYEAVRIVNGLRPDYAVWENVPGLLSSGTGRDFLAVLTALDDIGYCGAWTVLDAQFFGVAQRRQRVFGVFARRDIGAERCAEILSLAARLPWNTETRRAARTGVAAAIAASAGHHGRSSPRGDGSDNLISAFAWHRTNAEVSDGDTPSLTVSGSHAPAVYAPAIAQSNRGREGDVFETVRAGSHGALPMVAAAPRAAATYDRGDGADNIIAVSLSENQRGELRTSDVAAQLTSGGGKPGQGYPAVLWGATYSIAGNAIGRAPENGPQRGDYNEDVSFTLNTVDVHATAGAFGVRRFTPRECERLQGFEDDWTAWGVEEDGRRVEMFDSTRYRMLGNAVCRKVSAWIDSQIVRHGYA